MRNALGRAAVLLLLAVTAAACAAAGVVSSEAPEVIKTLRFETDEGTWMNLDVSPDGDTIVFDLLGDLYRLPMDGGSAEPLRRGTAWDTAPQFSPDGAYIAFVSDGNAGTRGLWLMMADGTGAYSLTEDLTSDVASFTWAPDGQSLTAVHRSQHKIDTVMFVHFVDGRQSEELGPETVAAGSISRSSETGGLYLSARKEVRDETGRSRRSSDVAIYRHDAVARTRQRLVEDAFAPEVSADGRQLAFARNRDGATSLWIRNLETAAERKLLARATGSVDLRAYMGESSPRIPAYTFTPDGKSILTTVDGKILRVDVETAERRLVPFVVDVQTEIVEPHRLRQPIEERFGAKQLRWLNVAANGNDVAFSAAGDIWVGDLSSGTSRRLTDTASSDQEAALSPDGTSVAYVTRSDTKGSSINIVAVDGGASRTLWTGSSILAAPRWSPDGEYLAIARLIAVPCAELGDEEPVAKSHCERHAKLGRREVVERVDIVLVAVTDGSVRSISHYWESLYSYGAPPALVFGNDGRTLTFSRFSAERGIDRELVLVDLASGTERVIATVHRSARVGLFAPSPDGRYIVLGRNNALWVRKVDRQVEDLVRIEGDLEPSAKLRRIGPDGRHVSWVDADSFLWTFGRRVFRWNGDEEDATEIGTLAPNLERARPSGTFAFENARVVTMDAERVIESGTVLVTRNRIVAVGPGDAVEVPENALHIDAAGKTIVPGFVDTHAHPFKTSAQQWGQYFDYDLNLLAMLAHGVTTIFDPQASGDTPFVQADLVAAGRLDGPRLFTTGEGLMEPKRTVPWTFDRLERAVRQRAENGAIMIKSYMLDRRDQRQAVVRFARAQGLGITTEGGGRYERQLTHIADGNNALEHNQPVAPVYRDVIEYIARSGVFYTPTLVACGGGITGDKFFLNRGSSAVSAKARRFSRPAHRLDAGRFPYVPDRQQHVHSVARAVQAIAAAGGNVTIGGHGFPHGLSTHWDMWLMQMGGMSPGDVLRAATVTGAQKLGLEEDLGSLVSGKLADFVVLDCNPLENIRCTAEIRYVVKNGFVYDADSMARLYPAFFPLPKPHDYPQTEWDKYRPVIPEPLPGTVPAATVP